MLHPEDSLEATYDEENTVAQTRASWSRVFRLWYSPVSSTVPSEDEVQNECNNRKQSLLLLRFVFYFTLLFSVSEVFAGVVSNSLLLIEESVHMFADSTSYGVNLWAELQSNDETSRDFAQLVGSGVSIATLCGTLVFVFFEGIARLNGDRHPPIDAKIMLGFGIALTAFHAACLLAYYCGVNILHSHSHSGGHGHSHGHAVKTESKKSAKEHEECECHGHGHGHGSNDGSHVTQADPLVSEEGERSHATMSLNLASAIFHVFVDFLHSAIVIITACIVLLTEQVETDQSLETANTTKVTGSSAKIDAIASLFLCVVIFSGCVVLIRGFYEQLRVHLGYNKSGKFIELEVASCEDDDACETPSVNSNGFTVISLS